MNIPIRFFYYFHKRKPAINRPDSPYVDAVIYVAPDGTETDIAPGADLPDATTGQPYKLKFHITDSRVSLAGIIDSTVTPNVTLEGNYIVQTFTPTDPRARQIITFVFTAINGLADENYAFYLKAANPPQPVPLYDTSKTWNGTHEGWGPVTIANCSESGLEIYGFHASINAIISKSINNTLPDFGITGTYPTTNPGYNVRVGQSDTTPTSLYVVLQYTYNGYELGYVEFPLHAV